MKLMSKNISKEKAVDRIIRLMQTDESVDAPADAIKWAKNIFRARAAEPEKSVLQKVLAVLQVDLQPNKAAFGERSAPASQARQMLFKAGENIIDLRIKSEDDGFSLHGQILGEDFANGIVEFGDLHTAINKLGEFKFAKIPGGKYDLNLQKDNIEIIVENLRLD